MIAAAPALTPDAALALGIGKALGLLRGRALLARRMERMQPQPASDGGGWGDGGSGGSDGESWTDGRGHRHTRITSMQSLYAVMPRKE